MKTCRLRPGKGAVTVCGMSANDNIKGLSKDWSKVTCKKCHERKYPIK